MKRDRRYNGICFYGVITTFIYCRFQCPSKKPLHGNTRFFFSRKGAEKAGFRPCKRCRPEKAEEPRIDQTASKVLKVCHYLETCDYIPTLDELSRQVNLSPFHLQREFKKVLGITPRNYADALRQLRFKKALESGEDIALATYDAGYGSSSRLYEKSSRFLGMTPNAYQQKGRGQQIYYSVFQQRVWDHLRTIPEGQTMPYSELAAAIDQPTAARAVARACATNPVAIVIPCHRVVPKTGGAGGYRWGAERKERLLALEKRKRPS